MTSDIRDMIQALRTIEAILRKYGLGERNVITAAIAEAEAGKPGFADGLAGLTVWGGSGSLADIELKASRLAQPDTASDQRAFQEALIVLADYLNAHEVGTESMRARAREIAVTFRRWNETIYRA